jgi:radical SAM superfamily enzyme
MFRDIVGWYKDKVDIVKDAYDKGSKNCHMISPNIQKDVAQACAEEVTSVSMDEIQGRKFSVLIDESRNVSIKEQMTVILRLVLHNYFVHRFYYNYFYNYTNT